MRLVATTRLFQPYPEEVDLLLLKLYLEDPGIDQWIFTENDYAFNGEYKGHQFKTLFETDARFTPYRDKMVVIETSFNSTANTHTSIDRIRDLSWDAERFLKNSAAEYIGETYRDDTLVAVTDVDEMLDFRDPRRASKIREVLKQNPTEPQFLMMLRYWFDYDNWAFARGYPVIPAALIRQHNSVWNAFNPLQHEHPPFPLEDPKDILAFEYSACCSLDLIVIKIKNGPFGYITREDFTEAFKYNYGPKASALGETWNQSFKIVELDEWNSPAYVRDNLAKLKTHNIDPNYEENRDA